MKKFYCFMAIAVIASNFLASCQKDITINKADDNLITVTLSVDRPGIDPLTKTELSGNKVLWNANDAIGVSDGANSKPTNNQFTNTSQTSSETTTFTGKTAVSGTLYAYYPYSSIGVSGNGAKVQIESEQTSTTTSFDGSSDVLVSKPFALDAEGNQLSNLEFRRLTAIIRLVIKDKNEMLSSEQVTELTITSSDADITGRAYVDFEECDFGELYYGQSKSVKVTPSTPFTVDDQTPVYACVYPGQFAAGTKLTISGKTNNDREFSREFTLTEDINLESGKITTINASIREEDITGTDTPPVEGNWSHTFVSPEKISDNAITVDGATWTITCGDAVGTPTISAGNSYSNYGLKFGSSASVYYKSVTFTTDYFNDYAVKSVTINVLNNGKKTGTLSAMQDQTTIGTYSEEFSNPWKDLTVNTTKGEGGQLSITYSVAQAFWINSITVEYEDLVPGVPAPTNVQVTPNASNKKITVSWVDAAEATGYDIYDGSTKLNATEIAPGVQTYDVTDITWGKTYSITVMSNKDGFRSGVSAAQEVVVNQIKLATPTNVTLTPNAKARTIGIEWDAVTNATSYSVFNGESLLQNVTETSCVLEDIVYGQTYSIQIQAKSNNDNILASDKSIAEEITVQDPSIKLFSVSPCMIDNVPAAGGEYTITVSADNDVEWELNSEENGLSFSTQSSNIDIDGYYAYGIGGGTISVTIPQNSDSSVKEYSFEITTDNTSVSPNSYSVEIEQEAGGVIEYEWVLVSSLEDLTEGTYVLASVKTAGKWACMPNTESTGSNPALATLSTPSNNKLTDGQITDAMKWSLTSTGTDGQFYVRPNGSTTVGLGCTASTGKNIRISGSYKDVKWTFTESQDYNWQIANDATTTMYLAVYADDAWRNYTSATTNQNGKFYLFKQVVKQ